MTLLGLRISELYNSVFDTRIKHVVVMDVEQTRNNDYVYYIYSNIF